MLALATLTTFLGAALLFVVQPLAARTLLPVLGGSPAVWNTAMVFFQTALLAGYLWAHVSVRVAGVRRQARLHVVLALLVVLLLPVVAPATSPPAEASPVGWLLVALARMVGPFVVGLSANATLVQRWFAASGHPGARDPSFLYAASNAGSLLALAAYPLLIEPRTTLVQQWRGWVIGYAVFAVCTTVYALLATRRAGDKEASTWVALAAPGTPSLEALGRAGWQPLPDAAPRAWTDDYVDLIRGAHATMSHPRASPRCRPSASRRPAMRVGVSRVLPHEHRRGGAV